MVVEVITPIGQNSSAQTAFGSRQSTPFAAVVLSLVLWLAFSVTGTGRAASPFEVRVESDSLALRVQPNPGPEVLPEFVRERLDVGIPATVGIQVDLMRTRSGWFDRRVARVVQRFRVSRDAWSGNYLIEGPHGVFDADSLGTITSFLDENPIRIPLSRAQCTNNSKHWIEVTAVTVPLSVEDLQEVENWVDGEVSGEESGSILDIPKALFHLVRDLTGLGDRKLVGRSDGFEMSLVAGDYVWVQPRP